MYLYKSIQPEVLYCCADKTNRQELSEMTGYKMHQRNKRVCKEIETLELETKAIIEKQRTKKIIKDIELLEQETNNLIRHIY